MDMLKEFLGLFGTNRYIQASAAVLTSLLAAKIANWTLKKIFPRLTRRTRTEFDDEVLARLSGPVFNTVLLAGFAVAFTLLQPPVPFDRWGNGILKTVLVLIWLVFGIRFSTLLLSTMAESPKRFGLVQSATLPLFDNAAKIILLGAAAYFVLVSWDVNVTGWLASAGILGLAIGFAAKDTLGNLIAGVSIMADAPYKVGDYVVLDTGQRGQVTRIGMRSTRILTRDDIEITIPNSTIAASMVVNESGGPSIRQRIRVRVGVAYGSDIDLVRNVLLEVAKEAENICGEPEPRVRFREFGDSGLIFDLLCWIEDPSLRGLVQDALNSAVYKAFAQAGIEIPFPKRDVYIKGIPSSLLPERTKSP